MVRVPITAKTMIPPMEASWTGTGSSIPSSNTIKSELICVERGEDRVEEEKVGLGLVINLAVETSVVLTGAEEVKVLVYVLVTVGKELLTVEKAFGIDAMKIRAVLGVVETCLASLLCELFTMISNRKAGVVGIV